MDYKFLGVYLVIYFIALFTLENKLEVTITFIVFGVFYLVLRKFITNRK